MNSSENPIDTQNKVPSLQLNHVTVQLDREIVLKNIQLTVNHGDMLVLVGPSGGGKTVLLKTMAGIYKPTEGQVLCKGADWQTLTSLRKHELAKHIGVQFQKNALFDSLTSAENIAFPLIEHTTLSPEDIDQRVKYCLQAVNLKHAYSKLPHDLSGGMRQRLSIARAIALNPDIVLYDDPTAGLDPINTDLMGDLILELQTSQKSTVVIATHTMDLAYKLAGTIALVTDQEVIITGNQEETLRHPDPRVQQFIHGRLEGPLAPVS